MKSFSPSPLPPFVPDIIFSSEEISLFSGMRPKAKHLVMEHCKGCPWRGPSHSCITSFKFAGRNYQDIFFLF